VTRREARIGQTVLIACGAILVGRALGLAALDAVELALGVALIFGALRWNP
jgi:hypothetical protein